VQQPVLLVHSWLWLQVAEQQRQQAAEAAERRRQERELYRGEVSTEFLSKFNTTSR